MKKTISAFVLLLLSELLFSQSVPVTAIASLPSVVNESSGIEQTAPNIFFSHNDSGGQPELYKMDSSGTLLKTIKITNAGNIDWEDLAQDDSGYVYIGDFGNNNNNRSASTGNGLRIYKVFSPGTITGTTAVAGIINFEYADRKFSAPATNHNFDAEGFFFYKDSLHIFSKNRTSPTNGWIKHYVLPSVPGTYTAAVVDSFNNGGIRITSADISPNKKTVTLLAENRIYLFYCWTGSKFISTGSVTTLTITQTQKEAIVFVNDSTAFLTDENTGSGTSKIYRSNLKTFIYKPVPVSISSSTLVCSGNTVALSAAPAATFTWSTGSNSVSIIVNPTISTVYSVSATDSKGCTSTAVKSISVNPLPSITVTSNPLNGIVCSGSFATLNGNGATSYTWTGGITDAVAFTPTLTNNYTVTGTDANGCKNTAIKGITVNPLPTITITQSSTVICIGQNTSLTATGASSYTWNTSATGSSVVISPSITTNYSVIGTDASGCQNSAVITQGVSSCTGLTEQSSSKGFIVYPVPNNGTFTIKGTADDRLTITDQLGQIIEITELNSENSHTVILNLSNGIYFATGKETRTRIVILD